MNCNWIRHSNVGLVRKKVCTNYYKTSLCKYLFCGDSIVYYICKSLLVLMYCGSWIRIWEKIFISKCEKIQNMSHDLHELLSYDIVNFYDNDICIISCYNYILIEKITSASVLLSKVHWVCNLKGLKALLLVDARFYSS